MSIQRIRHVIESKFTPGLSENQFNARVERLVALLHTCVESVASRLQTGEAVATIQVGLEDFVAIQMNAAGDATHEEVLAVIEIERNQIQLFLVIVVGDEFLGVTKALFGDDDDYGLSRGSRKKIEKISEEAERDFPEEEDSVSIEDMLSPKKRG